MKNIVLKLLIGIAVSFFYFPFEFSFLPGVNTKMMLAALGIATLAYQLINQKKLDFNKHFIFLFIVAAIISLVGFFSMVYNNTCDKTYATYIISMLVWISSAFFICSCIRTAHGQVTIPILTFYLAGVCIAQCILALAIDNIPELKIFIDTYILQGQSYLNKVDRLYGIGASLDTAGTRFAACLIMIGYTLRNYSHNWTSAITLLMITSFFVIFVMGNFIARTTSIGLLVILPYLIISGVSSKNHVPGLAKHFLSIGVVATLITIVFYNKNEETKDLIRFGFEGFVNLIEKGRWEVDSNETLKTMIVFPDNTKTWIIGDGYFENPSSNENYIGETPVEGNFYMGTDVGYLRFLFYFGIIGLLAFVVYMIHAAATAAELLETDKWLPYLILIAGLIIWIKVSTDLFNVLSLLICIGLLREKSETDMEIEVS